MRKIILLGTDHDGFFARFFFKNLARRCRVTAFFDGSIQTEGNGEELLLFSLPALSVCHDADALIILLPGKKAPPIPPGIPAIISSDRDTQLEMLAQRKVPVFTCGLSQKDTFTFSSKSEDCAVVSLMRRITTMDGVSVDPCEMPVAFESGCKDYPLLACTAALLLTGLLDRQNDRQTKYYQT